MRIQVELDTDSPRDMAIFDYLKENPKTKFNTIITHAQCELLMGWIHEGRIAKLTGFLKKKRDEAGGYNG